MVRHFPVISTVVLLRSGSSVEEIGGVLQDDGQQALYEVALEGDGLVEGEAVGVVQMLRGQGGQGRRGCEMVPQGRCPRARGREKAYEETEGRKPLQGVSRRNNPRAVRRA